MGLLDLVDRGFSQNDFGDNEIVGEILQPEVSSIAGCPSPTKERTVVMRAKTPSAFQWTFVDRDGQPIPTRFESDESDADVTDFPTRCALFYDPFRLDQRVYRGKLIYNENRLLVLPPSSVRNQPAIYKFEVHWLQPDNDPPADPPIRAAQLFGEGLLSVEESALRQYTALGKKSYQGPLSLTEIRNSIRDYTEDNDILARKQFTDLEIFEAIAWPIKLWNELPPNTSRYSTANFPHRVKWLEATSARLFYTEAMWMLRNQMPISAEGVQVDDRAKWKTFYEIAKNDIQAYEQFVRITKQGENIRRGFHIM